MKLNENKTAYNKKMIGKDVLVLGNDSQWKGVITRVISEETFEVENLKSKKRERVDMFKIRGL